jgi:hypothetical protein
MWWWNVCINNIDVVFSSLIVNRITYCLPVWAGFLSMEQVGRIGAVFKWAKRYCVTDHSYDAVAGLIEYADGKLSSTMQHEHHCLHHLLTAKQEEYWTLRLRGHTFVLPRCRLEFIGADTGGGWGGSIPATFIPALSVLLFLGGLSPTSKKIFRLAALAIIIPPLANLSRRPCWN